MSLSPRTFVEMVLDRIADLEIPEDLADISDSERDQSWRVPVDDFTALAAELGHERRQLISEPWSAFLFALRAKQPDKRGLHAAFQPVRELLDVQWLPIDASQDTPEHGVPEPIDDDWQLIHNQLDAALRTIEASDNSDSDKARLGLELIGVDSDHLLRRHYERLLTEAKAKPRQRRARTSTGPLFVGSPTDADAEMLALEDVDTGRFTRAIIAADGLASKLHPDLFELGATLDNLHIVHQRASEICQRMGLTLGLLEQGQGEDKAQVQEEQRDRPHLVVLAGGRADAGDSVEIAEPATQSSRPEASAEAMGTANGSQPIAVNPVVPSQKEPTGQRWRLAAIGGVIAAAAGIALVMLAQEPPPSQATAQPIQLPLGEDDYPTCEPTPDTTTDTRPASALIPTRRKASQISFVGQTDSVIVKRKKKNSLKLTVTEVAEDGTPAEPAAEATRPKRSYTISEDELGAHALSIVVEGTHGADFQLVLEPLP